MTGIFSVVVSTIFCVYRTFYYSKTGKIFKDPVTSLIVKTDYPDSYLERP